MWERPAAWLPHGTAYHTAVEKWELSGRTLTLAELIEIFDEEYDKLLTELLEETPNIDVWFASGPYEADFDIDRRRDKAHTQIANHLTWHLAHPAEKPCVLPEHGIAVEVPLTCELDGVTIHTKIDAILGSTTGPPPVEFDRATALIVRDNKTGTSTPKKIQLVVYAVVIKREFKLQYLPKGDFYLADKGRPTLLFTPPPDSEEIVTKAFVSLDEKVRAGDFPPLPSPEKCRMCSVSYSCAYAM